MRGDNVESIVVFHTEKERHPFLHFQETTSRVNGKESIGKDKCQDSLQLHDNIQSRSGSVLERISHSVANDGCLVNVRALSLALAFRAGRFNVFLGIVLSD
jgi:hypothetical protein